MEQEQEAARTRRVLREWNASLDELTDSKTAIKDAVRIAMRHPPAMGDLLHALAQRADSVSSSKQREREKKKKRR